MWDRCYCQHHGQVLCLPHSAGERGGPLMLWHRKERPTVATALELAEGCLGGCSNLGSRRVCTWSFPSRFAPASQAWAEQARMWMGARGCGALERSSWAAFWFVVVVQSLSRVWLFATPWTAACLASLSFTIIRSLLRPLSIESVMPSNHLCLRFSFCLQSFPASGSFPMSWLFASGGQRVGASSFQHQSFQWTFVLISFRIDWFDFLAVQGTLNSLLQHHSSKAPILVHAVPQMAHLARLLPHYLFILGLESHCFWGPVPPKAPSFPQVEPIMLSSIPPLITFALICIWFVSL